ncbi:hypothetical protein [Paenibacillus aquistagni]|uniref:hypothetical protein n=1 Tax=Paenibacillus aquistagni TaxID=1852522 RepID=UPI00145B4364|nr:hypothetical protein [Paenibacillus aquistagni]NMM51821.1 hypothetical protein [Paenibacillus aquistagni]
MEHSAFHRISSELHWLSKTTTRKLTHVVHCKNLPPSITSWSLKGSICDYCALYLPEGLFILVRTVDELLLLREANQAWLELRLATSRNVTAPYICKEGESIYISYVMVEDVQLRFVVRSLARGVWNSQEAGCKLHSPQGQWKVKQSAFSLGDAHMLYGLLQLHIEEEQLDILVCVRINLLDVQSAHWQELDRHYGGTGDWQLSLARDEGNLHHASWGIPIDDSHGCHYYYCTLHVMRPRPVLVWKEEGTQSSVPHFIFGNGLMLLLFMREDGHMVYGISLDQGRHWQRANWISFGDMSSFLFTQITGVRDEQYYPMTALGVGDPEYRIFNWFDLCCPWLFWQNENPYVLHHALEAQLSYLHSLIKENAADWVYEVTHLAEQRAAIDQQLQRIMVQWETLEHKEKELETGLRLLAPADDMEHLPLRHIR